MRCETHRQPVSEEGLSDVASCKQSFCFQSNIDVSSLFLQGVWLVYWSAQGDTPNHQKNGSKQELSSGI